MNVRDQTRQAFGTGFCPFCDRTSLFTDVKSQVSQYEPDTDISEKFVSKL